MSVHHDPDPEVSGPIFVGK